MDRVSLASNFIPSWVDAGCRYWNDVNGLENLMNSKVVPFGFLCVVYCC